MSLSLQVLYPVADGTNFNYNYYFETHVPLVAQHLGAFVESTHVTKGLAGGPNVPAPMYAIATMNFRDQAALDSALAAAGPVLADIPNYTNTQPIMLIGEVYG